MNKQQLANRIWESANKMRSKIEANEYKDYILGFMFYKYLSDKEIEFLLDNDFEKENLECLDNYQEFITNNLGYFISYKDLFSTWLDMGKDFDVSNVTDALSAFTRNISKSHKKVFDKIFDTLQTGLSKLGDTSGARTKAISGLLQLIKDIPMDGKQDYDVLGFVYEYLIEKFASNAGKKAGEFYTPHEVSLLMSEIVAHHLRGRNEIKIYDPTSGSGSLLINIGRSVSKYMNDKNNIMYYAKELKENTYNLTRMNLVMRGILPSNIITRNGDTLEDDWPEFDENDPVNTYNPLYVDAVVSNPPYSQAWDPSNKETDERYKNYGIAPRGKADYAFLLHDLYHIKPDGIMTIVLPHGVLFRGGEEGEIRKNLIEKNNIDTIIGLPANIFYGTGIPTIIMVLRQKRENTDTLIIDASKGFIKEGKNNKLRACDIKKIVDVVTSRESVPGYSKKVSKEEIRNNDYNLNIPRYVDSSEKSETWDIYATMFGGIPMSEINELDKYWRAFPNLLGKLFTNIDTPYAQLAVKDIKEEIKKNEDVLAFENKYNNAFSNFNMYLENELIKNVDNIVISKEEEIISEDIFARLDNIPLIDKYEAYQLLDDEWAKISTDIEMIQTEGRDAIRKVDANMVIKKKAGKEVDVQEGWIGHIVPFELAQEVFLQDEYNEIKKLNNRLSEIPSEYEEIIESLTEEEKESDVLNDDNSAFVGKEVTKSIKELSKEVQTDDVKLFIQKLKKVDNLLKEEKEVKAKIKKKELELHNNTKVKIENMTDDEAITILKKKWIDGITTQLSKLPNVVVDSLVKQLQELQSKYETTMFELEQEIAETEKELCSMIDELEGNEYDMKGLSEFKALLMGE